MGEGGTVTPLDFLSGPRRGILRRTPEGPKGPLTQKASDPPDATGRPPYSNDRLESFVNSSVPVQVQNTAPRLASPAVTPQVGWHAAIPAGSSAAIWLAFALGVLIVIVVVGPAIWSRKPARRKAAAQTFDRIARLLRPGPDH